MLMQPPPLLARYDLFQLRRGEGPTELGTLAS